MEEVPGDGPELKRGDLVFVRYDMKLNQGEVLGTDVECKFHFGDRDQIAGFNYGLEGMRVGGTRVFKASPHLCYRDQETAGIPKNAALVFHIKTITRIKRA